jgi:hypothetical protein
MGVGSGTIAFAVDVVLRQLSIFASPNAKPALAVAVDPDEAQSWAQAGPESLQVAGPYQPAVAFSGPA